MDKRIARALKTKACELSTIKEPKMSAIITREKKPYSVAKNEAPFVNKVTLIHAPGTTEAIFNKLRVWYLKLPKGKRSIKCITELKEVPC
jgi:hypothetical protein